jgi:hypothetical protein
MKAALYGLVEIVSLVLFCGTILIIAILIVY